MTLSRRHILGGAALAPLVLAAPALLGRASVRAETAPLAPVPAFSKRRIGGIEVIALHDGTVTFQPQMLVGYDDARAAAAAKVAHKPHDGASMVIGISAYLIRTKDRLIAVDTGAPAAFGPTAGGWHESLAAAGVAMDAIDTVLMTHLHPDHVGGLTEAKTGARLLPNATLVASVADWDFTHDDGVYARLDPNLQGFFDASRALVAPYASTKALIEPGAEIAPGVSTLDLKGHTPGHLGIRIEDGGESLLIWGDLLIAPAYQFGNPGWAFAFDADPATAVDSRKRVLDMAAADGLMVAGMHLDRPGFGYVEREGTEYRYVAAPPDERVG